MTRIVQHMFHCFFPLLTPLQNAEQNMTWSDRRQLKQRRLVQQSNEAFLTEGPFAEETSDEEIDSKVVMETHHPLLCQTNMTLLDLDKKETENVQINEELSFFMKKT